MREEVGHRRERSATDRLVVSSFALGLALALYHLASDTSRLAFLPWNLLLAWVPYVMSGAVARVAWRTPPRRGVLLVPTGLWLLFFPNAPYVVTDFVHLRDSPATFRAFEALLIAGYAALALALGVRSLYTMHGVVRSRWGRASGRVFVVGVVLLAGVGVWIGRVLRWNSWDALVDPMGAIGLALRALASPWEYKTAIAFSMAFGVALLAVYAVHRRTRPFP